MILNSEMEDYLNHILEKERFNSEMEQIKQQNPVSIEIIPVELITIIIHMQLVYKTMKATANVSYAQEIYEFCQKLEKAFEIPPTIKKKIDEKWKELRIQGLD